MVPMRVTNLGLELVAAGEVRRYSPEKARRWNEHSLAMGGLWWVRKPEASGLALGIHPNAHLCQVIQRLMKQVCEIRFDEKVECGRLPI